MEDKDHLQKKEHTSKEIIMQSQYSMSQTNREEKEKQVFVCSSSLTNRLHKLLAIDPPSQTTSYRPISLLSAIMELFNDHLFRLSQTIMKSFNRGEHVIAAFPDVEKAFHNVWHNGFRYKIYQLDLSTKLCRWLSDVLIGRVIQVKIEGFLSPKVTPKQAFHKVKI